MRKLPIAIQLYTVREELKSDFRGTLKRIAELGYDGVEFAWIFGDLPPQELAEYMKFLGLRTASVHIRTSNSENPEAMDFAYAKALGAENVVCSCKSTFAQSVQWHIDWVRRVNKIAESLGFKFAYHNHDREFLLLNNGKFALDELLGDDIAAELDVYWISKAGQNPLEYIQKYSRRLPLLHLKDRSPETGSFTELGTGDIPLRACVEKLDDSCCKWLIYEQDICNHPSLKSAEISIRNLKRLLGY